MIKLNKFILIFIYNQYIYMCTQYMHALLIYIINIYQLNYKKQIYKNYNQIIYIKINKLNKKDIKFH